MYVKKREVSCKWLELATWGKKRREIFLKYNFFVFFFLKKEKMKTYYLFKKLF